MAIVNKTKKAKKLKKPARDYCLERKPQSKAMLIILLLGIIGALGDNIVYGFYNELASQGKTVFLSLSSMIGCITFTLLCYWTVEKYHYIRQREEKEPGQNKTTLRNIFFGLFLLALICEVPFDSMKNGSPISFTTQNLMFTVSFGFLALCAVNKEYDLSKLTDKKKKQKKYNGYIRLSLFTAIMLISAYGNFDYGGEGVALIILLDFARKRKIRPLFQFLGFAIFAFVRGSIYYAITIIALIIIYILQAKKNYRPVRESKCRSIEYSAFVFYMAQIAAIMIIKLFKTAG